MIAASPDRFESLQLFQLTLLLLRGTQTAVPKELQEAFMAIIEQARALSSDPKTPSPRNAKWRPEAIKLALLMRRREELAKALAEIRSFESIEPQLASRVLTYLESGVAA